MRWLGLVRSKCLQSACKHCKVEAVQVDSSR